MTRQEFDYQLLVVADIQRREGWSERSIGLYEEEIRALTPDECLPCTLMIGADLAQDNSRFGVYCKTAY
jgi:hypothetical protein